MCVVSPAYHVKCCFIYIYMLVFYRGTGQQCLWCSCPVERRRGFRCACSDKGSNSNQTRTCWSCQVTHCSSSVFYFRILVYKLCLFCVYRLCSDGDKVLLCYTTENSRVYHKEEPKSFEIQAEVNVTFYLEWLKLWCILNTWLMFFFCYIST